MPDIKTLTRWVLRSGKRIAITLVGFALLLGGLAMLVLPGPGILVVLAGLAVLGSEYAWARWALDETKKRANKAVGKFRKRKSA